ncbi:MAG: hypothetical protein QW727_03985 [Candidatus Pacearchaeota archaeon]
MRKDTILYRVLKYIYLNRDREVTSRDISNAVGIPTSQVHKFIVRLIHVKKRRDGRIVKFYLPKYEHERVKKFLEIEDDESIE